MDQDHDHDMTLRAKKRRRPRAIQACERCRLKKYKCDESRPVCSHCERAHVACQYGRAIRAPNEEFHESSIRVRNLEAKIAELSTRLSRYESTTTATILDAGNHASSPQPQGMTEQIIRPLQGTESGLQPLEFESERQDQATAIEDGENDDGEITDVNQHTNDIEFHGNTSSLAFIGDLERTSLLGVSGDSPGKVSLVSTMHNQAFPHKAIRSPASSPGRRTEAHNFFFNEACFFIDGYFSGLHFMHPIIDKITFMAGAHKLWWGSSPAPSASFVAKYFALLSLGALTRPWPEEHLNGSTRFEWSRKLFGEALKHLDEAHFCSDIDAVHCLFLMAKICQNELIPHLSWIYLGHAVRICISAGFNRETRSSKAHISEELSRTWWSLYSLEIETSFALGRSDTLGHDEFHNRTVPAKSKTEHCIIPCMMDFSRIIRKVSLFYAHRPLYRAENVKVADQLEAELDLWITDLPTWINPLSKGDASFKPLKEPDWCRRHKLVLELRYNNVRMALFRGYISIYFRGHATGNDPKLSSLLQCANKCLSSAERTIELMHETFKWHDYFRSWWYNTTYIVMAAAAVLSYMQLVKTDRLRSLRRLMDMAVEVLAAMDESNVARKYATILKEHLEKIDKGDHALLPTQDIAQFSTPDYSFAFSGLEGDGIGSSEQNGAFPGQFIFDYSFQDIANIFEGSHDSAIL